MEVPEKIYLVPFGRPIVEPLPKEGGSDVETIWSRSPYGNKEAGNIEYTRTNAFIEKLESFLNKKDDRDSYTIGYIKKHLKEIIKEAGL